MHWARHRGASQGGARPATHGGDRAVVSMPRCRRTNPIFPSGTPWRSIDWAARGQSVAQRDARLKAVCRLVRHVRVEDVRHELPPVNHFGARKTRRSPHIYSAAEIDRLIEAALRLRLKGGLRSRTYATLIALLTGFRISEALKLTVADVTRDGLLIRETKFRKTRLAPLAAALHCGQRDLRQAGRQGRYRTGGKTPPASARSAAHVCGARAARQSGGSKPKRRAYGGACDLHGSRQHLCDLLVSGGHRRPHARRRRGR